MKSALQTILCVLFISSCSNSEVKKPEYSDQQISTYRGRMFTAFTTQEKWQKLELVSDLSINRFDPKSVNGLIALQYYGETIGYQHFVNGVKHGAYFEVNRGEFHGKKKSMPDGMYKNGKKHGFFYRYFNGWDLDYLAYYENDKLLWAELYRYRMQPKEPYILKTSNLKIKARHPNGALWFQGEYKNGKPYGKHAMYNDNGELMNEIDYTEKLHYGYVYYQQDSVKITKETFNDKDIADHSRKYNYSSADRWSKSSKFR